MSKRVRVFWFMIQVEWRKGIGKYTHNRQKQIKKTLLSRAFIFLNDSGGLVNPVSDKQICIAGTIVIPVRRKHQFLSIG